MKKLILLATIAFALVGGTAVLDDGSTAVGSRLRHLAMR